MKKIRKAIIAVASLAVIAALFGGCTVKETKYVTDTTDAPVTTERQTTTTVGRSPEVLSTSDAIAAAQSNTPTLYVFTDAEMITLMGTACDSLDQWDGDYEGFLLNAQNQMANESTLQQQETSSIIIAAVFSICTYHQIGLIDTMNAMGY